MKRWRPVPLGPAWTEQQASVADAIAKHHRVAVRSANGTGKTHLCADLAVSYLLWHQRCIVVVTAPTRRQLEGQLHAGIRKRAVAHNLETPGQFHKVWTDGTREYFAFATNRVENIQGWHAEHLFIIVDEASGYEPEFLAALEGCAVGRENKLLLVGNPTKRHSALGIAEGMESYAKVHLSALDSPNIRERRDLIKGAATFDTTAKRVDDWCSPCPEGTSGSFTFDGKAYLPNNEFRVRVLGEWPDSEGDDLFDPGTLRAARSCVIQPGRLCAAVDVAGRGGDQTVLAIANGNQVLPFQHIPAADLAQQARTCAEHLHKLGIDEVTVDATGLGLGFAEALPNLGVRVDQFHAASSPLVEAERFRNRRAEAYVKLSYRLRQRSLNLPKDDLLDEELLAHKMRIGQGNLITVTPKDGIIAELGRSPNRADALSMLAIASPAPTVGGRRRQEPVDF